MRRQLAVLMFLLVAACPIPATHAAAAPARLPHKCLVADANGDLPTCTKSGNGSWVAVYPDSDGSNDPASGGIPSGFIALFVIVGLIGVGTTIWRISLTRRMAKNAGVDPSDATALAVLGGANAIDTALLAKTLSHHPSDAESAPAEHPEADASVEARLKQLHDLKDSGYITAEEYESRRAAIINAV